MSSRMKSDVLADAAGFGDPFEVLVARAIAGHGEDEVAPGKPLVAFD